MSGVPSPFVETSAASALLIMTVFALWYESYSFSGSANGPPWEMMLEMERIMASPPRSRLSRSGAMFIDTPLAPTIPEHLRYWAILRETLDGLPPVVFVVAWTILYGLNAIATYYFFQDFGGEPTFWYTFVLLMANLVTNKAWTLFFFDRQVPVIALVDLLLCLGTAIAVLVLFAVEAESAPIERGRPNWVPFALWIPYVLWLCFALYLNTRFLNLRTKQKERTF
jgi:tryptophan-rich sensory protein